MECTMAKIIRTESDRCAPKPVPLPGYTMPVSRGQKRSLERGTATRSKKNPGKRPKQGG
jgi:hypothetical protein